jgi:polyphenol oxidase
VIRDSRNIYISELLLGLPWLRHGFGTRHQEDWPGVYTRLKQIHSCIVVDAQDRRGVLGPGDAMVTSARHNWIGVRTADCVPVLLADRRKQVVAAVHAGWRGTVANVAGNTVETMQNLHGSNPADIVAAIGPSIGVCCFEVGPEIVSEFERQLPGVSTGRHVDLVEANRRQLLASGITAIDMAGLCTKCLAEEFHSYRRENGVEGRMVSAIRVEP